jgi:hypothetical protein
MILGDIVALIPARLAASPLVFTLWQRYDSWSRVDLSLPGILVNDDLSGSCVSHALNALALAHFSGGSFVPL